ncbi:MAG: phosphoglycerate mutase family protein, partial [Cyanobacteria bacterium]|nr:phosphoglycerate mutase family protein [Cyanobacteriota bacterium]
MAGSSGYSLETIEASMRILFIRHGESTGNVAGRMAGQSDDGLSPLGCHQSTQLAQWLYTQGWQPSHIYTSSLRRAVETLAILAVPWAWLLPAL